MYTFNKCCVDVHESGKINVSTLFINIKLI